MKRGFKAGAVRLALEIRSEFGLGLTDPFDPYAYFSTYGIPVVGMSELEMSGETIGLRARRDPLTKRHLCTPRCTPLWVRPCTRLAHIRGSPTVPARPARDVRFRVTPLELTPVARSTAGHVDPLPSSRGISSRVNAS